MLFFFNDTATTEIYTLSLHDALPIWMSGKALSWATAFNQACVRGGANSGSSSGSRPQTTSCFPPVRRAAARKWSDRKSTRLNSSHANISYAVFCLKKKKHLVTIVRHL